MKKKVSNKKERITVYIDIDHRTKEIEVIHPEFGVKGRAGSEGELRYLLGEMTHYLGQYVWDKINPWNGEDDENM